MAELTIGPNRRGRPKKKIRIKQYSAPALSKGLDILELLAIEQKGLMLKEIADKLERSKSEIFRMLVVLEQRAYVASEPNTDKYMLTLKLFELAHQHPRIKRLTNAAAPFMSNLSKTVEQSCHLVIYNNGKGLVIAQQDSSSDQRFSIRLGTEIGLANTCSGHLFLAYADDPLKRTEMLREQSIQSKKRITKVEIKKIIGRILKQGCENVASKQIRGVNDIGYPIFDFSGKMVAALVIPFLEHLDNSNAVNYKKTKCILQETASALSKSLGYIS